MTTAQDATGGQDWSGARVLVTGARGFIGTHLCHRLLGSGADVHGVSTRVDTPALAGMAWARIDLSDSLAVRRLVESTAPDVVFHLAGHVTGAPDLDKVEPTLTENLVSTVHLLLAAARTRSARVVIAGSMREPSSSQPDGRFGSPYAVSKWAASGYARMFHELYGLPVITTRLMMVYGPGQWDSTKLVPYVMTCLLNGASPALRSGAAAADWVFVDDVVDGLLGAAGVAGGQEVEIGTGKLTTVRAVAEQIRSVLQSSVPIRFDALPDRPFERARAARTDDARRLFGWEAKTDLAHGLASTAAWYQRRSTASGI